jgi:hypothetical protein
MTEPTVAADVRGLLAAIARSLDVPLARWNTADEQARERLLTWRTDAVRIAVEGILAGGRGITYTVGILNAHTTEAPVSYAVWEPAGSWVPADHCDRASLTLRWESRRLGWELRRQGEQLLGTLDGYPDHAKPNGAREALAWAADASEIPADRWIQRPARSTSFHTHVDPSATCAGGAR